MFIPVGTPVSVMDDPDIRGEVSGHYVDRDGVLHYIVGLQADSQFFSENRDVFVRNLVVHPSSIAPLDA